MTEGRPAWHRATAMAGIAGTAVILLASIASAAAYVGAAGEPYSPLNHFISELGEVANSELAWLFNAGLVAGGLCLAGLMGGLGRLIATPTAVAAAVIGVLAGMSGMLVGIFPMDQIEPHTLASLAFFGLAAIAIAIFTARPGGLLLLRDGPAVTAATLAVGSLAAFLALALAVPEGTGLASPQDRPTLWLPTVLEWLALGGTVAWVAVVSIALLRPTRAPRARAGSLGGTPASGPGG